MSRLVDLLKEVMMGKAGMYTPEEGFDGGTQGLFGTGGQIGNGVVNQRKSLLNLGQGFNKMNSQPGGLLGNIPQSALLGSALFGQGMQGKDPFSALLPAVSQTAQLQQYMTPKASKPFEVINKQTGKPELITNAEYAANPDLYSPAQKQPLVSVTGDKFEPEYLRVRGKQEADAYGKIQEKAVQAQANVANYELVNALSQNIETGFAGEQLLNLAKFGKRLNINTDWITKQDPNGNISLKDNIGKAEALEVLQVQFALDKIQKTKGSISDTEFKKFLGTSPGLSMSQEGIQTLTEINKKLASRDIEEAQLASQWEQENGTLNKAVQTPYGKMNFRSYINMWKEDPTNRLVDDEFLNKIEKISQKGSNLYDQKQVYKVNGVLYRKLKGTDTVVRIGAAN